MTQGIHTVNQLKTKYSSKGTRENAREKHCKKVNNYVFPQKDQRERKGYRIHTKQVKNDVIPQRNKRNFAPTKQGFLERNYVFPAEK